MPVDLKDIEASITEADRIATEGKDRDGALTVLAKGMADGMRGLVGLLKARKPPMADDEGGGAASEGGVGGGEGGGEGAPAKKPEPGAEGGGGEGGGGEGGGEPDEDENEPGSPGYDDLRLGGAGGEEFVDATEYVIKLEKTVKAQGAELKELRKAVKVGNDGIKALGERFEQFIDSYVATTVPLQKGVMDMREALLDIPAQVHAPGITGTRAIVKQALAASKAKEATGLTVVDLSKAMKARIIDEGDARNFKLTGKFLDDDAKNGELIEKIKALK